MGDGYATGDGRCQASRPKRKMRAALAVRARAKSGLRALVEGSIMSPRTLCANAVGGGGGRRTPGERPAVFNTRSAKRNLPTTMRLAGYQAVAVCISTRPLSAAAA
jgi:hypothetical protein